MTAFLPLYSEKNETLSVKACVECMEYKLSNNVKVGRNDVFLLHSTLKGAENFSLTFFVDIVKLNV